MTPARSWSRVRKVVLLGAALWLVGSLLWLGATRWHGVPADPQGLGFPDDYRRDPLSELYYNQSFPLKLAEESPLQELLPAPAGMAWKRDYQAKPCVFRACVLEGEWTPETRPHLRALIKYFESDEVDRCIREAAELDLQAFRRAQPFSRGFFYVPDVLLGRARCRHTGRGETEAALDDIDAFLRLVRGLYELRTSSCWSLASRFEDQAARELRRLVAERPLTGDEARRLIHAIESILPGGEACWQCWIDARVDRALFELDLFYTCDADGDGWLVLSYLDRFRSVAFAQKPRSGAWNLLSPLFNSRRQVLAKIADFRAVCESVRGLPFEEAHARLKSEIGNGPFSVLDGAIGSTDWYWPCHHEYCSHVRTIAERRAAVVAVALSAYRYDHGRYPETLDVLVGVYLDELPDDPFAATAGVPFGYRPEKNGADYTLYSMGKDGVDDGGRERAAEGDDVVFKHAREVTLTEPVLERVSP